MKKQSLKHSVQVRQFHTDGSFTLVTTIKRKLWMEQIGNFAPLFCRYNGQRCLVESDKGDVSDPFRADPSYAETFFIQPRDEQGKRVITAKQAAEAKEVAA